MSRPVSLALCALVAVAFVSSAAGAEAIFPVPLHLTREVHDPISGKTVVLNEYGYGNRLVSVRGDVTAIADYEKGELTEIDRRAGTYSVTRFATIAKAVKLQGGPGGGESEALAAESSLREQRPQPVEALGAKATKSGRTAEFFRAEVDSQKIEVAVDRSVRVSQEALEVLLGAAYPGTRSRQQDVIMSAARGPQQQESATYALPLEQTFEVRTGEEPVQFRSSVLRVGNEPPPADAVAIPAGARLVVSRTAAVLEELELLDSAPLVPPAKKP
jgi:hypothetical protein